MTYTYAIRIWVDEKPYEDGWHMSLHSTTYNAMMAVLDYVLGTFNIQQYYDEDDDSNSDCCVSSVINTVREEFEKERAHYNLTFEVKHRNSKFKKLQFHVGRVPIH
jgi:hypothetical protein